MANALKAPSPTQGHEPSNCAATKAAGEPNADSKPSALKRAWATLGLDRAKLALMFKGALPPTISIALYQLDRFAATFPTLGYLVGIMSILSMAMLPRSKFFQNLMFNVIGVCIGACVALLTCYCSVQARLYTSAPTSSSTIGTSGTQQAVQYNSSASAVAAIWLFVNVTFSNAMRFFRPQLNVPVIMYSIFAMVSGTYAATFTSIDQGIAFVKMLLEAFLSGFGVATVVNLLVFPTTARKVVFSQMAGYVSLLQKVTLAQQSYLQTMTRESLDDDESVDAEVWCTRRKDAARELKATITALGAVHGKLHGDLTFAKREIALGYLDGTEISRLAQLFRRVLIPFLGLTSVVDIFQRLVNDKSWDKPSTSSGSATHEAPAGQRASAVAQQWADIASSLSNPFEDLSEAVVDGLTHVAYVLKLSKKPRDKDSGDPEADAKHPLPGDVAFSSHLAGKIAQFAQRREGTLRLWCSQRGLRFPDPNSPPSHGLQGGGQSSSQVGENSRQQLYLILYMEYLIRAAAEAVLALVRFADEKVESGTMRRQRLIVPRWKTIRKWARNALDVEDTPSTDSETNVNVGSMGSVHLGDAFKERKDPEHLPPTNVWERLGTYLQSVPKFLGAPEVGFGFRVACATMSIAVMAYLEQTQRFFFEQRVVWALIMIAIGMTMTTGSGAFGLTARVVGTVFATAFSLLIWYIAGSQGYPGAVIPVLFIFLFLEYYAFLRFQQYIVVVIIVLVTQILVVGYELEAGKIGPVAIASNGQEYYPIYLLAPYRLAAVAAGCFVAAVFTYFPFPITARTTLRHTLGDAFYLLSNYYSVVHSTASTRLSGTSGDPSDKRSPAAKLDKASMKLVAKIMGLVGQLQEHERFVGFELPLGGKFPREHYRTLIQEVANLTAYMSVIAFSTGLYARKLKSECDNKWLHDLSRLVASVNCTSQEVTCILALLSLSLSNSVPLPPYLKAPESYHLNVLLSELDPEILSIEHFLEPGYSAFAVTQVASRLISDDLRRVVEIVKSLVGEVDFSFHIISTSDGSKESLSSSGLGKGKQE